MESTQQVFLGDCRNVLSSLAEQSISACITDPPYNYEFVGHKWDADEIARRTRRARENGSKILVKNIPYGSGLAGGVRNEKWYERNRENILEYQKWCLEWGEQVFRVLKPGGIIAVFNSTRTVAHVQVALEAAGFYARDCLVYRRPSGIPKGLNLSAKLKQKNHAEYDAWKGWHSCLRNEWEAIAILQKPLEQNYLNTFMNYEVGLFFTENPDGSFQSNIIENVKKRKDDDFNVHCTVKPLALMEKLVEMFVPPSSKHIVLDPFAGSGTTLVAAKNLGRSYIGIEVVPEYIPIIERRLLANSNLNNMTQNVSKKEMGAIDLPESLPLFD
ncbi:MAG: site-specific DNA-methyltransferase [Chloroflexi bacterium]|nr:site-specific DNA-methyltransferase [Chloroflexota bacterium]MCY4247067.1 site-specific DNA-methyltransferase [Chloroflexota bacterium]